MLVRGTSALSRDSPALSAADTAKDIRRKGPEKESGDPPGGDYRKKMSGKM